MSGTNPVLSRLRTAAAHQYSYSTPMSDYEPKLIRTSLADVMSVDDVLVKAGSLIAVTATAAVAAFCLIPASMLGPGWTGLAALGIVLGLISWFAQLTSPGLIIAYAVVEGVFLGAGSHFWQYSTEALAKQAILAMVATIALTAVLFWTRIVRTNPRFMRMAATATAGFALAVVADTIIALLTEAPTPVRDGSLLAVGFSLACVGAAAMMLVANTRQIADGVRSRLPRRCGWFGGFGFPIGMAWMYLEILRLITYAVEG